MKKTLFSTLLFAGVVVVGTGCLKDKGFENHEYGLTDPANGPKGISFVQSPVSPLVIGVKPGSTELQKNGTRITVEADQVAQQDITVTLTPNPSLLGPQDLTLLRSDAYQAPSLTVTIPKGQRSAEFAVNVNNTNSLSTDTTYGLAYTISSVSGGDYQIVQNNRNIIFAFQVQNIYDGRYRLRGAFSHPTAAYVGSGVANSGIELRTYGPNSVVFFYTPEDDYIRPIFPGNGPAQVVFGVQAPIYTIDAATNAVTVSNYWQSAGGSVYEMNPAYTSRYDPATKTIYASYGYSAFSRLYTDTLTYLGPR